MPGVYSGPRRETPGGARRDVGPAGMPFRTPSGVLGGHTCCPQASAWGGAHSGADALPARRALPHFLSCERAWVRSDWHRAVPGNYKDWGPQGDRPGDSFSCPSGTVTPPGHPSGTTLPSEP